MERGWKPNVGVSPACPRCGSSNTKFCYYNNYSLTQPRYFCKGCRRYWTKGGSLRNVPIGGGCRKSRRGKLIRMSTDSSFNSRNSVHNQFEPSSSISAETSTSNIDLAAVYANFLNQAPRAENHINEVVSELHEGILIPSIEFSNFQLNSQSPLENGFLECGQYHPRLSDSHLFITGGEDSTISGWLDEYQKQRFMTEDSFFTTSINTMDNDVLPPLPGEEVNMSPGMMWPNYDEIFPNQILRSNQEIRRGVQPAQQNSEVSNGNMKSPFSGLNLEAIFRP